ncbi:unnamed protein product [Rhizophagus irregularis]|nr:unnamed protein product [Rhizophagus irregularis]
MTPLQNTYPPSRIQKPNLFPRPRQYFTNNEALFTNTDLKFEGDYTPRRYDVLSTLEEVRINNISSQIWNRLVQRHSEFTFQPTKDAFLNTAYVVGVKRNCPTNQHIYL